MTLISTACSWVNMFGGHKAAIFTQVGQFYFGRWVSFSSAVTALQVQLHNPVSSAHLGNRRNTQLRFTVALDSENKRRKDQKIHRQRNRTSCQRIHTRRRPSRANPCQKRMCPPWPPVEPKAHDSAPCHQTLQRPDEHRTPDVALGRKDTDIQLPVQLPADRCHHHAARRQGERLDTPPQSTPRHT